MGGARNRWYRFQCKLCSETTYFVTGVGRNAADESERVKCAKCGFNAKAAAREAKELPPSDLPPASVQLDALGALEERDQALYWDGIKDPELARQLWRFWLVKQVGDWLEAALVASVCDRHDAGLVRVYTAPSVPPRGLARAWVAALKPCLPLTMSPNSHQLFVPCCFASFLYGCGSLFLYLTFPATGRALPSDLTAMWYFVGAGIAATCLLMLKTNLRDPGYIDRRRHGEARGEAPPAEQVQGVPVVFEKVRGFDLERKWCSTCQHLRPLRAAHCRACDTCVDRLDHHCHVIGACIGRRNHMTFVFVLAVAAPSCIAASLVWLAALFFSDFFSPIGLAKAGFGAASGFVMFFMTVSVCRMLFAQFLNFIAGRTSRERLKRMYHPNPVVGPFNDGFWANMWTLLTEAHPVSEYSLPELPPPPPKPHTPELQPTAAPAPEREQ